MFNAFTQNELLLSMLETVAGDDVDLEPARKAFEDTRGDFRAKFTAAVQARLAQIAVPEVFIDLPEHPDEFRKADLEALVRPVADGFLRSYPSKDELLTQVARIRRRQAHRPAWIPRVYRYGNRITSAEASPPEDEREPDRPLPVTALTELGEVTVMLPAAGQDRPELAMASGGIGEWESALFTFLGLIGDAPATIVTIDAAANESLIPDQARWWSPEPARPVGAAQDPGVASELLATSPTLGGLPVIDTGSERYEVVIDALAAVGDWRHSPQWTLEAWDPTDDVATLAVARAAIAGWADEHRSGVAVFVYGGALHTNDGLFDAPTPLHSYALVATRSTDGTDTVDTVHRVNLTCPGQNWCHRGGSLNHNVPALTALLMPAVTAGHAAAAADSSNDERWAESYQQLYGDGEGPDYTDSVLEHLTLALAPHGWAELTDSTWEGGLEQTLLRRGEHCLSAAYDPVTRQMQLTDGKAELESVLDMLADDGVLTDNDGQETVDTSEEAVGRWGADLLTAATDLLAGRIKELPQLATPIQITMLGLHPHADGTLRGPEAPALAEHQLGALLHTVGLFAVPA
ncbi:hypothetical protein [Virgisporangium aurantiacum]|uniref:hypothetical protein n=1 Tax=Virgisporangium aurantiacum TaxID=175570 RepID=UPI001951438F|nr:hypothetical protein [Virgisporangium aurantiacum]